MAMTYDHWKTTEPEPYSDEPVADCDCCGRRRVVYRCWAFGIETYACEECHEATP